MSAPPPSSASASVAPASDPPPPPPPPRKFPAPCWTQEETLALITAYKDKWYSLRRSNLRTPDWESVAADVTHRCPDQSPPKSSAQCRHKMEKLRKRYRTEKQRFLSLPHNPNPNSRLFSPSSWVFFDLMDSMDGGSNTQVLTNLPNGLPLKAVINHNGNPDLVEKPSNLKGDKDKFDKYFDEILMGMGGGGGGSGGAATVKFRVNNNHHHNPNRFHGLDDVEDYYDDNGGGGGGSGGGRNLIRGPPPGCKRKFSGQDYDERFDFDPSLSRKTGSGSRGRDSVAEMVASIKMLGEGMVKMETMKMEMMREIEKMRMEMEMKRSEMVIESQQLIVNAIVEGLKNNKKKVMVMEVEE